MSVALRPLRTEDKTRVLTWRNDPAVADHMYGDRRISDAEHEAWLDRALHAADRRYWIILKDEQPAGLANLIRIDAHARRCEWAYYLGDPQARGGGVGSAVEYLVIEHVFAALGLQKLWCEVFLENEAVWRLHERFGFKREALFRRHVYKAGRFRDVVGLGLLAEDWTRARPAAIERLTARGLSPETLEIRSA